MYSFLFGANYFVYNNTKMYSQQPDVPKLAVSTVLILFMFSIVFVVVTSNGNMLLQERYYALRVLSHQHPSGLYVIITPT